MQVDDTGRLATLVRKDRDLLLTRWREQVRQMPSARALDTPTLNDHIPQLIDELAAALESKTEQSIPEAMRQGTPPAHGLPRVQDGFDIEEVVAEYNILRGCVHDLADENGLRLQGRPFHIVNRVLDQAIGLAVQSYAAERALEAQARREEYLAFVAHDLRTPLHAISLAGRVLEQILPGDDAATEANRMLRALRRNVIRLEGLVTKILEENVNLQTETGIRLERRDLDLWPLVEALIHDLHPVAGTGSTRLVNEVPEDLVAFADAALLRRILQNLIANAIRHTPRGKVVIGARRAVTGDAVECWVTDNGSGIPPNLLDSIFEKGETHFEGEGAEGLGLAIVKTFTEGHGGKVSAESEVGAGSTFRFSLPRVAREAPASGGDGS